MSESATAFNSAKLSFSTMKTSDLQAKPFVKFDGTKLLLQFQNDNLDLSSVKVLSILGKARLGKSTFLNTIVSKLTQSNAKVFNCKTGTDHCTYGIDYCFLPEQNLLLLDSQGLANGDASHDPALLLFLYLVSDVLIFNDSKILQNEALKLIEPVCAFMTYIDSDSHIKPHLMFRISDGKLVQDTNKNLAMIMAPHKDQYQSIRESIVELFQPNIGLVKTETLDRREETMLDNNEYLDLLQVKENGFDKTIVSILDLLQKTESRSNVLSNLPQIIEQINNNEKITIDKLDVVAILAENEVASWISKEVDKSLYNPITVDGTQSSFEKNVETRQAEVKKKLLAFNKRFKTLSKTITETHLEKLKADLNDPINKAIQESEQQAKHKISHLTTPVEKDHALNEIHTIKKSLSSMKDDDLLKTHFSAFLTLKDACQPVYNVVKKQYEKWIEKITQDFFKTVQQVRKEEEADRKLVQNYVTTILDNFNIDITNRINALPDSCLKQTNDEITTEWFSEMTGKVEKFIKKTVKIRTLLPSISNKSLTTKLNQDSGAVLQVTHNLVSDIYTDFVNQVKEKLQTQTDALNEQKETLMDGQLYLEPNEAKQLYLKNPDITFVYDSTLLSTMIHTETSAAIKKSEMPYMTYRTWQTVYEPLYVEVCDKLKAKGLLKSDKTYNDFMIQVEEEDVNITKVTPVSSYYDNSTMYDMNIGFFVHNSLKKLYCKKVVEGYAFPKL